MQPLDKGVFGPLKKRSRQRNQLVCESKERQRCVEIGTAVTATSQHKQTPFSRIYMPLQCFRQLGEHAESRSFCTICFLAEWLKVATTHSMGDDIYQNSWRHSSTLVSCTCPSLSLPHN
ncbi:hypothetical protein DPMN_014453 [Dreissena polymorpha]|uniref:Uncharacterized protein n=1 Tax=Dreissena polymorpha TaxID=45954 RepID=A0A9D4N614_DREPO|nr:hypothetical protein DPMN_014453 [Dreissena polymorpha]